MNKLLFVGTVTICLVSCSVKADRSGCPCQLNVSLEGGAEKTARFGAWNPDLLYEDEIDVGGTSKMYECEVPRGKLTVSAHSGQHSCILDGSCLRAAEGAQMDEIFAWNDRLSTETEKASAFGVLHKQYALIHITLVEEMAEASSEICVMGNVNGLDLLTLAPCAGEFKVKVSPVYGRYYRICVPRQLDDGLYVNIGDKRENFPLGRYIGNTGYDWTKEDLDDIDVEIDYSEAKVHIRISDWNDEQRYTYEI